jgi:phage terminase Nu1 subunit (DNA packaging protein)
MKTTKANRPNGTIQALATALKVGTRRVAQLLDEGMPDDVDGAQAWKTAKAGGDDSAAALRRERILLVRAQKERAVIENQARSGELVSAADVKAGTVHATSVARDRLMKFVNDLPPQLEGLEATAIAAILRREVNSILDHLSDPASYAAR